MLLNFIQCTFNTRFKFGSVPLKKVPHDFIMLAWTIWMKLVVLLSHVGPYSLSLYGKDLLRLWKQVEFTLHSVGFWSLIHKEQEGCLKVTVRVFQNSILFSNSKKTKRCGFISLELLELCTAELFVGLGSSSSLMCLLSYQLLQLSFAFGGVITSAQQADSSFPRKLAFQKSETNIKCWWPHDEFHFSPSKDNFTLFLCSAELREADLSKWLNEIGALTLNPLWARLVTIRETMLLSEDLVRLVKV